jgi:LacI family transcriptional regulator
MFSVEELCIFLTLRELPHDTLMTKPNRPVTLQDVADEAKVSRSTVSLALRNQLNLPWETRKKIQEIAKKLGYKPSPVLAQLMRYRRASKPYRSNLTLAYIKDAPPGNPTHVSQVILNGATQSAEKHGYQLECFWMRGPDGIPADKLGDVLYQKNIRGIILSPFQKSERLPFEWDKFSTVAIGYPAKPRFHRIVNHHFKAIRMAARHLRRMGYQRWGYAMKFQVEANIDHQWFSAFLFEQQLLKPENRIPIFTDTNHEWNETSFERWIKKYSPDVIISIHHPIVQWLKKLNLKIPQDIGFLDLYADAQESNSSGISQHPLTKGAIAVELVAAMIQRHERGIPSIPQVICIEGKWVNGMTLESQVQQKKD